MSEQYKRNRKYILSDLDNTFIVLSDLETASICGGSINFSSNTLTASGSDLFSNGLTSGTDNTVLEEISGNGQATRTESIALNSAIKINENNAMRQAFITQINARTNNNKNRFA